MKKLWLLIFSTHFCAATPEDDEQRLDIYNRAMKRIEADLESHSDLDEKWEESKTNLKTSFEKCIDLEWLESDQFRDEVNIKILQIHNALDSLRKFYVDEMGIYTAPPQESASRLESDHIRNKAKEEDQKIYCSFYAKVLACMLDLMEKCETAREFALTYGLVSQLVLGLFPPQLLNNLSTSNPQLPQVFYHRNITYQQLPAAFALEGVCGVVAAMKRHDMSHSQWRYSLNLAVSTLTLKEKIQLLNQISERNIQKIYCYNWEVFLLPLLAWPFVSCVENVKTANQAFLARLTKAQTNHALQSILKEQTKSPS